MAYRSRWRTRQRLSRYEREILLNVAKARGSYHSIELPWLDMLMLRGLVYAKSTEVVVTENGAFKRHTWVTTKRGQNVARQLAVRWNGRFYRSEWPPTAPIWTWAVGSDERGFVYYYLSAAKPYGAFV